jgi:adenosylhomocysteine nucleosidase
MSRDVIVVMALKREGQGVFEREGVPVLYTGLGKVNAAMALAGHLVKRPASLVMNFGTVGSARFATHELVACASFVQRDMDVTPLGFAHGETPFEPHVPARLDFAIELPWLPQAVCATGDRFETAGHAYEVVDMEGYALAKVCRAAGVRFACAKCVTDGADHAAAGDWAANLPRAAAAFLEHYRRLVNA